ncbi:MAG: HU family DNA-binding protein [Muribaculaceae bacterium]|nr:HU family DNA-binding protein [Muribaculaceae bacterium]
MNSKISLPELTALLALQSGKSKKICEEFLKTFFSVITETLAEGENVKIKGIGSFKISRVEARKSVNITTGQEFEIPAHNRVSFVPSKELAALVNAPFEAFDTVELSDAVTDAMLDSVTAESEEPETAEDIDVVTTVESEPEPAVEDEIEAEEPEEPENSEEKYDSPESDTYSEDDLSENFDTASQQPLVSPPVEAKVVDTPDAGVVPVVNDNEKKHKFRLGFFAGFGVAAFVGIIVWLAVWVIKLNNEVSDMKNQTAQKTEAVEAPENVPVRAIEQPIPAEQPETIASTKPQPAEVSVETQKFEPVKEDVAPTRPSDKPVYDKITKTRYLTTMAREYYGNYDFWPYIYEANANLGHPDRIRPGTRIKVPALSTLGINPHSKADIRKARNKAAAIYARYKTPMYKSAKK